MSRYRLRYQATDLEIPPGEFVIGRSSTCNLSLDDALVSRRHAILAVGPNGLEVQDLGSRNGVLVNGTRVDGSQRLQHLDRITIGSQQMVVIDPGQQRDGHDTSDLNICRTCAHVMEDHATVCSKCGAPSRPQQRSGAARTVELQIPVVPGARLPERDHDPEDDTPQQSAPTLLASLADKALALKRYEEAERILDKYLQGMLERTRTKGHRSEEAVRRATHYALELAEGLEKARWIDWVFEMNAATGVILTATDVERLHQLVRKASYTDPRALREYLAAISVKRDRLGAAERFVLQRLEGLERVIIA